MSASDNADDGIGSATYVYAEEQNGCHLKFGGATMEKAHEDQYELVDQNDSNSEHARRLLLRNK